MAVINDYELFMYTRRCNTLAAHPQKVTHSRPGLME